VAHFPISAIADRISIPVFLFGFDRKVMYANPAANMILDGRFKLKLQDGRLVVIDSELSNRFQSALDVVSSSGRNSTAAILLAGAQANQRAILHVFPPMPDEEVQDTNSALLGMINCAREFEHDDLRRLRQTLGFSEVEAQIAGELLAGYSPRELAKRRNSSEQTVRWHIKNMHSKTQTCRLTDLVLQIQTVRSPF
jgi:DNA-binding CsgD family transcriptional regulator